MRLRFVRWAVDDRDTERVGAGVVGQKSIRGGQVSLANA